MRIAGKLTGKLESRDLDLYGAKGLLDAAVQDLTELQNLGSCVTALRDNLIERIKCRFPAEEARWLNLIRLDFDYPTELTKAKFKNLCGRITGDHCGGMFQNNMEERAQAFGKAK